MLLLELELRDRLVWELDLELELDLDLELEPHQPKLKWTKHRITSRKQRTCRFSFIVTVFSGLRVTCSGSKWVSGLSQCCRDFYNAATIPEMGGVTLAVMESGSK